ncbi:MAG: MFS transporter [Actinobacteria bacterium]|nr:MFS transporter [Actinomycetota bacterium]
MLAYPAFVRLWLAGTISWVGTFTFGLALQLLLIESLDADQAAIGFVRSAQWMPALAIGMLAGVLIDRVRRRPVLIAADTVTALATGAIGALALAGLLTVPVLAALVALVGAASMFYHAATSPICPLLAGALVKLLSAPVAILFNAVSKAASAVLLITIRVEEPTPERQPDRHLGRELQTGASWVYRHRTLAPNAVSLHLWFFFNSAIMTVFVFHATEQLGLGALTVGLVLSCAGVSGVIGAGLAPRAAERFGLGTVCVVAEWLNPLAFLFLLLAPRGGTAAALLIVGQLVYGLGAGLKGRSS